MQTWLGMLIAEKSTSCYLFTFSGEAISWQSKLQMCVALSTNEAEYITAMEEGKEMLWLKRFLKELGVSQDEYVILCDSQKCYGFEQECHVTRSYQTH